MGKRHPNVTNLDEMKWKQGATHGKVFGYRDKWLAGEAGARQIGATHARTDRAASFEGEREE